MSTHQHPPPTAPRPKRRCLPPIPSVASEAFTRDELDPDDSDDPDFHLNPSPLYPATSHPRPPPHLLPKLTLQQEPHFDVDDLDSTDDDDADPDVDEDEAEAEAEAEAEIDPNLPAAPDFAHFNFVSEDEDDDPDFQLAVSRPLPTPAFRDTSSLLPITVANFPSEDEQEDPDFDVDILEDDHQDELMQNSHPHHLPQVEPVVDQLSVHTSDSIESAPLSLRDEAVYAQFLQELNPEAVVTTSAPPAAPSMHPSFNLLLDDDDEFNYMREAAKFRDDPLEYRNDLLVSRKEVAQLLTEGDVSYRRQTRPRAKRSPPPVKDNAERVFLTPTLVPVPGAAINREAVALITAASSKVSPLLTSTRAQASLPPPILARFQSQLQTMVQVLAELHANAAKSVRSNAADGKQDGDAQQVFNRSETMLRKVVQNRSVCMTYHGMLDVHISSMKRFSNSLAFQGFDKAFAKEKHARSVYDIEGLGEIEQFLADCEQLPVAQLPNVALHRMEKVSKREVKQALMARKRQFTLVGARVGWFTWTSEDDRLLAVTIAKYGRNVVEYSKDLLPHRLEDDCQARVRHLSSRRCPDNAVKRQVMYISTPLNKEEVGLVQQGLHKFGGHVDDVEVWKLIQRDLLPGREWSLLQKLWLWRESRRKTKAKYRAKISEKKKAMRNAQIAASAAAEEAVT